MLSRRLAWDATCELSDHICQVMFHLFQGSELASMKQQDMKPLIKDPPDVDQVLAALPPLETIEGTDILKAQTAMLPACKSSVVSAWGLVNKLSIMMDYVVQIASKSYKFDCRPRRADARAKHRAEKGRGRGKGKGKGRGRGRGRTVPLAVNEFLFLLKLN